MSLPLPLQPARSVLLITLDSCRYDTFAQARAPNLRAVAPLHRAMAPATFTFPSHSAIFRGYTPSVAGSDEPLVNLRIGKLFRLIYGSFPHHPSRRDHFMLQGGDIIEGFRRLGYQTIGTAAMAWFNEQLPTGRPLSAGFERFHYTGLPWGVEAQVAWVAEQLAELARPAFVFMNLGETHIPYWHEGASWRWQDNPCDPYETDANDAAECRRRQLACLEYVDSALGPLLQSFARASVLVCADHGDAWGEDGLWSHGFFHEKVLEVPLLVRAAPLPLDQRVDPTGPLPIGGAYARTTRPERMGETLEGGLGRGLRRLVVPGAAGGGGPGGEAPEDVGQNG